MLIFWRIRLALEKSRKKNTILRSSLEAAGGMVLANSSTTTTAVVGVAEVRRPSRAPPISSFTLQPDERPREVGTNHPAFPAASWASVAVAVAVDNEAVEPGIPNPERTTTLAAATRLTTTTKLFPW